MANSRSRFFALFQLLLVTVVLFSEHKALVVGQSQGGICSLALNRFLPPPYGNLSQMNCHPIWNTFVLRYSQEKDNVVSFVLSALYTSGWIGIGFSKNGKMVGSSAMVGWISRTGHARIKEYHANGYTPSEVNPGKGDFNFTSIPPLVLLNGANIYLAFQLKFEAPLGMQPTLLAYGSRYPTLNTHVLSKHDDKTTMLIDFSQAGVSEVSKYEEKMKRSHGVLGIIGWGLVLPLGAMTARFLRHQKPLWYYLHTIIQFAGFLIVLAGVVLGQTLYNRVHASVTAHRGIGYLALTLTILQALAFFIRPDRESKIRALWNTYHKLFGVVALFLGALDVVLGIQVGGAGSQWKIAYAYSPNLYSPKPTNSSSTLSRMYAACEIQKIDQSQESIYADQVKT
ncbi:hypothetical protein V2J09_004429 [Rumex salicifolius]